MSGSTPWPSTPRVPGAELSFVVRQRGMFSYSGLSKDQVRRLREEFAVYAIDTGRICVAALNSRNLDSVADAIGRDRKSTRLNSSH